MDEQWRGVESLLELHHTAGSRHAGSPPLSDKGEGIEAVLTGGKKAVGWCGRPTMKESCGVLLVLDDGILRART
jgi:hypothetical protein